MKRNASSNLEAFRSVRGTFGTIAKQELTPILTKQRDTSHTPKKMPKESPHRTPKTDRQRIHLAIKAKTPTRADCIRCTPKRESKLENRNVSHTRNRSRHSRVKSNSCTRLNEEQHQINKDPIVTEDVVCNIKIEETKTIQENTPSNLKETLNSQIPTNANQINYMTITASDG